MIVLPGPGSSGLRTPQRGPERGLHPGDAALDLQAGSLEDVAEVAGALVLLVGELGGSWTKRCVASATAGFDRRQPGCVRRSCRPSIAGTGSARARRAAAAGLRSGRRRPPAREGAMSASLPATQSANCAVSREATSATTPRPYSATAPRSASSVTMSTLVPPPAGASVDSIVASALPRPLASRAFTPSTARPAGLVHLLAHGRRPANWSAIGPSLTCSLAFQASSSTTSASSAPGMHGTTSGTSFSRRQAARAGRGPRSRSRAASGGDDRRRRRTLSRWQGIAGSWWSL